MKDEESKFKFLGLDEMDDFEMDDMVNDFFSKTEKKEVNVEEKGFLPKNEEFSETMTSPQEEVENNATKYIIEECLPACKELWRKNIYTFMVSNHQNEGECWIEMELDALSEDNQNIYVDLPDDEVVKFSYHNGTVNFGVNAVGIEGQTKLLEIAKKFIMQDVQEGLAYLSKENFLMSYCNCYEDYSNPDYKFMKDPLLEGEYNKEAMNEYNKWKNSIQSLETLRKFDASKMTKSLEEYVKDNNMILDNERVYLSEFHYKKHLNYINSQNVSNENTIKRKH